MGGRPGSSPARQEFLQLGAHGDESNEKHRLPILALQTLLIRPGADRVARTAGIKAGMHGKNPAWAAIKGAWRGGTSAVRAAIVAAIVSAILLLIAAVHRARAAKNWRHAEAPPPAARPRKQSKPQANSLGTPGIPGAKIGVGSVDIPGALERLL